MSSLQFSPQVLSAVLQNGSTYNAGASICPLGPIGGFFHSFTVFLANHALMPQLWRVPSFWCQPRQQPKEEAGSSATMPIVCHIKPAVR
jgi:hypothetical protein